MENSDTFKSLLYVLAAILTLGGFVILENLLRARNGRTEPVAGKSE